MNYIGIDIVENDRIKQSSSYEFINKILTENELKIYKLKKGKKKQEYLCGRFAAKEAIIKCISDFENPNMKEIEILNDDKGKPLVKYKTYSIGLSIAHERKFTTAIAILNN